MERARPDILDYEDFRQYLRHMCRYMKLNNPNFSYRYFARKAGFSSASYLSLIIDGKRRLTKDYVPGFARTIGLNRKEHQFFDALVSFNQAETVEAKRYYLELMHNLRAKRVGKLLSDGQFEYLSRWYYPVIRELITLPTFIEDCGWIRKRLFGMVAPRDIKAALELMLRHGLITRDERGRLVQTECAITTGDDVKHSAAYSFHQQMLSLAKNILVSAKEDTRDFSALTMAVSKRQFDEIKSMVVGFREAVARYVVNNPDVPSEVVQLNLQLFTISGRSGGSVR